jgi:hypothetical protein
MVSARRGARLRRSFLLAVLVWSVVAGPGGAALADDLPNEIAGEPTATTPVDPAVAEARDAISDIDAKIAILHAREQELTLALLRIAERADTAQGRAEHARTRLSTVRSSGGGLGSFGERALGIVQAQVQATVAARRAEGLAAIGPAEAVTLEAVFALQERINDLRIERADLVATMSDLRGAPVAGVAEDGVVSRAEWALAFLRAAGLPTCEENVVLVVAWETQEGTDAAWNPLATTLSVPGATAFNGVGVRDYASLEQGIEATRLTLVNGAVVYGYAGILSALAACAPAETTALAVNASSWCAGCTGGAYLTGLLPLVRADLTAYASAPIGIA